MDKALLLEVLKIGTISFTQCSLLNQWNEIKYALAVHVEPQLDSVVLKVLKILLELEAKHRILVFPLPKKHTRRLG